jgi:hypothetical protein
MSRWQAAPGSELAGLRVQAHNAFDCFWQIGNIGRSSAYRWLAAEMGMPDHECHIGMFNREQCLRALNICRTKSPVQR